jgi:hypothetical protein
MEPSEDEEHLRELKRKELDRLSLELLSNTTHYKKYLAKSDPESKHRTLLEMRRFGKHKSKLAELFLELLEDYEDLGTTSIVANTSIQRIFKECVEKAMQFIEWRDCMESGDDDTLFEHVDETAEDTDQDERDVFDDELLKQPTGSFWGKPIHKSDLDNVRGRRLTYK